MEYLIKQTKGKVSGQPKAAAGGEGGGSFRGRKIPVPKTESFKDKRRVWFGRTFSSRQIDLDPATMVIEKATAVAAAAYAIAAGERPSFRERRRTMEGALQSSLTRGKSEMQGSLSVRYPEETDSDEIYEDAPEKHITPVSSKKRTPTFADKPAPSMKKNPSFTNEKPVSSIKKTPTFMEKPVPAMEKLPASAEMQRSYTLEDTKRKPKRSESQTDQQFKIPETSRSASEDIQPRYAMEDDGKRKHKKTESQNELPSKIPETFRVAGRGGKPETAADAWEKVELEKLKEKYERENEEIDSWENEKKANAKHRLDKTEGAPERARMKALGRYHNDVDTITQIAEEARASTAKKQRKKELEVKEKASIYRRTGKVPKTTCSCF